MGILDDINKTDNDIIVVLAHNGPWVNMLSEKRKLKLLNKADLILGATSHRYQRYYFLGEDVDTGAIAFNTGAVGNSFESGFIQVHVLKSPTRMIIQYQKTNNESRELQGKGFAFEKVINGKIKEFLIENDISNRCGRIYWIKNNRTFIEEKRCKGCWC